MTGEGVRVQRAGRERGTRWERGTNWKGDKTRDGD